MIDEVLSKHIRFQFESEDQDAKQVSRLYSFEDLYDFELIHLDSLYKQYHKKYEGESLFEDEGNEVDSDLKLKLDAIKHVFNHKKGLKKKEKEFEASQEIKQKLKDAIKNTTTSISNDEIEKMIHDF